MKPVEMLLEPEAKGAMPSAADELLSVADWLNVSHSVMKLTEWVTGGINPGQWLVDYVTGDWASYSKAGSAMVHLGEYYAAYGQALTEHKNVLMKSWQGHAATAADAYFTKLADAVAGQQEALTEIGEELHKVAYRMWTLAKMLDSQLENLLELMLEAAIGAALGTATAETILGPIAGYALAALRIKKAERVWQTAVEAHDKAYNAVLASLALILAALSKLQSLTGHPLPQGAYDHPGA
ncbi:hypothetical protein UK23_27095 [Lentzea aerocolonigenes]|uniref:Uncharacterized protein n=1 Tax=Lentzea aerocolonigenes TaxID=68170 RepID=A0A0F0GR78_LENAE|nr:WXG100 family type VII secretion target [Lentzea aerocolonigenes]KJK45096.1 hypothetical protein UK23_27095 [Lentzea aerocolonigenes]